MLEKLTEDVLDDDDPNYTLVQEKLIGTTRWHNEYELIVLHKNSGKYYSFYTRYPTTEMSGSGDEWEDYTSLNYEVEKQEVVVTKWVEKKDDN